MPWATAEIMVSEAQEAMDRGDRTSDIVNAVDDVAGATGGPRA